MRTWAACRIQQPLRCHLDESDSSWRFTQFASTYKGSVIYPVYPPSQFDGIKMLLFVELDVLFWASVVSDDFLQDVTRWIFLLVWVQGYFEGARMVNGIGCLSDWMMALSSRSNTELVSGAPKNLPDGSGHFVWGECGGCTEILDGDVILSKEWLMMTTKTTNAWADQYVKRYTAQGWMLSACFKTCWEWEKNQQSMVNEWVGGAQVSLCIYKCYVGRVLPRLS